MPLRDEFKGEGIEALLARTRRQMSLFILGAAALIVALVGVGGAVAGNSALDAGLDNALVARAERIVAEIQEELPPLPEASPDASGSPRPSSSPEETEEPEESEGPEDERSPQPSGDVPLPSREPEDEGDDNDDDGDGDESGRAPSTTTVLFIVTPGAHRDDAPPSIPPGITDEEFGAGGPWAVLDATGAVLARSEGGGAEFPVITLIDATATRPIAKTVLIGRTEFRVVTTPIRHPQDPNGEVLGYVQVAGRLDV
ncbi:MAG: hypothetical protein EBT64_10015, partial [Gammaproteobacteria bacterium]|nr:hypothetical protein [Gammaproteobacteria bacterium]